MSAKRRAHAKHAGIHVGLPPGSAVYTGERSGTPVAVNRFVYDHGFVREEGEITPSRAAESRGGGRVLWVDVDGLHDVEMVSAVCEAFGLHALVGEDVLNPSSRPKLEDYGDYLFMVLKIIQPPEGDGTAPRVEQISLVLGSDFVITFQELPGDVFDPVRERIRAGTGRVRRSGADYLAYALVDSIVDVYFLVLEHFAGCVEALEDEVLHRSAADQAERIYRLRREIQRFRKDVAPLRDVVGTLHRTGDELIRAETQPYIGDLHDHLIRVTESVDSYREAAAWALDLHLAMASHRMNDVMRVLTVVSTVFMPLTFIVGVYGMNFEYMPELQWRSGYFDVMLLMLALSLAMIYGFRRRGWL